MTEGQMTNSSHRESYQGMALRILILTLSCFIPGTAHAYIGPGAGISAIGSLLALVLVVLLAVVGFVWYPVRRLLRRRKKIDAEVGEQNEPKPS